MSVAARVAWEQRVDELLTDQSVGIAPLPVDMAPIERDDTPRDRGLSDVACPVPVLEDGGVWYAQHWVGDGDYPESMQTGPFIMTTGTFELAVSCFMAQGSEEGTEEYERARRKLEAVCEMLRHRLTQATNWDRGTTFVVNVRDFRMSQRPRFAGRNAEQADWRLEARVTFQVVFDEVVEF